MKYHMLGEPKYRQPKRRGRGIAAGSGKTCGRGTKGQNSRSSGPRRPGFEGGQTPLHMRLPKLIGFKSHRMPMQIIKTSQLGSFQSGAIVNSQTLEDEGLIENRLKPVKLLFDKEIGSSLNVSLDFCSRKAQNAIESAGGSFKAQPYRPLKDTADKREES